MIGYWFVLQVVSGFGSLSTRTSDMGGTAFFAHIGGFLAGVIIALLFKPKQQTAHYYE
jgi:membrane associated rhomboid family serine protease